MMTKRFLALGFVLMTCAMAPLLAASDGSKVDPPAGQEGASATSVGRFGWWEETWRTDAIWSDEPVSAWDTYWTDYWAQYPKDRVKIPFRRFENRWDEDLVARINLDTAPPPHLVETEPDNLEPDKPLGLQKTVVYEDGAEVLQGLWGLDVFAWPDDWGDSSEVPHPQVESAEVESVNWVSKTVAVRFVGDLETRYKVSYNALSPGVLVELESDEHALYLRGADGRKLAGVAWVSGSRIGYLALSNQSASWPTKKSSKITENWLLLWFAGDKPYQVPVLITMSGVPERFHGTENGFFIKLAGDLATPRYVVSLPFGVETVDPARAEAWNSGTLPAEDLARFRMISRLTSRWPVDVKEYFTIDRERGRVVIEDRFSYRDVADGWSVALKDYAPIPPVATFAAAKGLPVEIVDPVTATGYPTKYGELKIVDNSSISRWSVPLPPEHGLAYVGPPVAPDRPASVWRERIDDQIRLWTAEQSLHWFDWGALILNQDGTFSSLALADAGVRDRFLRMVREMLDQRLLIVSEFDNDAGAIVPMWQKLERCGGVCETAWREQCEVFLCADDPPEDCTAKINRDCGALSKDQCEFLLRDVLGEESWESLLDEACNDIYEPYEFYAPLHIGNSGGRESAGDIDVAASLTLEALYEYASWSGDWEYFTDNDDNDEWDDVNKVFSYLARVNDWAWMASAARPWGDCGALIDMFPSQYMGYLSYARMAGILGKLEERDLGLYFAARAQISMVARFPFRDEAAKYYLFDEGPGRIASGFGETEPVIPRYGASDEVLASGPVDNLKYWADFTISGERIHPLVYDIYDNLGDYAEGTANYFDDLLTYGEALNNTAPEGEESLVLPDNPFDFASFPEDKIFAFRRFGRLAERADLVTRVGQMYTPHTLTSLLDLNYDGVKIIPIADTAAQIARKEEVFGPLQIYMKVPWEPVPNSLSLKDSNVQGTLASAYPRRRFPVLPALVEAYGVPVRLGSWAPAVLTRAEYEPDPIQTTGTLTAHVEPPAWTATETPRLKVLLDGGAESVLDVRVADNGTDIPLPKWSVDDLWSVLTVDLGGTGPWDVEVDVADSDGEEMVSEPGTGDDGNFVVDGGFESCGMNPHWEMAWDDGWGGTVFPAADTSEAYLEPGESAGVSMRMETFEASQICNAIQSVHFGELGDSPVPFLVGFRYKVPADAFPQDTVFQLQILGFEDVALEGATGYWLCEIANNQGCLQKPPDGLTSRVDPCPEEWMYVECGGTMCTGCTNVMIRFFLNNAGNGPATVYVDDVSLAFVEE